MEGRSRMLRLRPRERRKNVTRKERRGRQAISTLAHGERDTAIGKKESDRKVGGKKEERGGVKDRVVSSGAWERKNEIQENEPKSDHQRRRNVGKESFSRRRCGTRIKVRTAAGRAARRYHGLLLCALQ